MLETIGAAPGVESVIDWPAVWRSSDEYKSVQDELHGLQQNPPRSGENQVDKSDYAEFAAPLFDQLRYATARTFQQYWRSPSYINSKALLTIGTVSTSRRQTTGAQANMGRSLYSSGSPSSWPRTLCKASRAKRTASWPSCSW
jgi:hypothetical protein